MGLRFRKSKKIAPGVRLNISKKSIGVTLGGKRGHFSINTSGRSSIGASLGHGVSYNKTLTSGSKKRHKKHYTQKNQPAYQVPSTSRKGIKTSNAVACIIAFSFVFLLWIVGISSNANITLIKVLSILAAILFILFIVVNNVPPLKQAIMKSLNNSNEELPEQKETTLNFNKNIIVENGDIIDQAAIIVIEAGQASVSYLQRKLKISFAQAAHIMDELKELGVVGCYDAANPRLVLITREMWEERKLMNSSNFEE